jgi:hypothetical protein
VRLLQLISRLHAALLASEHRDLRIAATFEGVGGNPTEVQIVSLHLAQVLFAPTVNTVILHFAPIATIKKSLDLASQIQQAINAGEVEILGESASPDSEDETYGGLPF